MGLFFWMWTGVSTQDGGTMRYGESEFLDRIVDALVDPAWNTKDGYKLYQCNSCSQQCVLITSLEQEDIKINCILSDIASFQEHHGDL